MLVTIDIGNTHCCLGLFDGPALIKQFRVATNRRATADELGLVLDGLFRGLPGTPVWEGVVISSVVPELDANMALAARQVLKVSVLTIKSNLPLPIKNHYHAPHNVGADRLMSAVAAVEAYGAPVIMVDFGTATTIDVVGADRAYLGGAIMPGVLLSAEALAKGTSLLPRVELKMPQDAFGRDTDESMRCGILLGAAGAVEYLVQHIKTQINLPAKVVATGGWAPMLSPLCPSIEAINPNLVLEGMRLTWLFQRTQRTQAQ